MDHTDDLNANELLESLDRSLHEVEALQAIYSSAEEDGLVGADQPVRLELKSTRGELERARSFVEDGNTSLTKGDVPTLALEMHLMAKNEGEDPSSNTNTCITACVGFSLPPAYPAYQPVSVTVLTSQGLSKTTQQDLSQHLQSSAKDSVGSEAIMELVQICQEQLEVFLAEANQLKKEQLAEEDSGSNASISSLSRRWIWVHHITDRQRKEDIVEEANAFHLGGYLKAGYPGVVVVEGTGKACDDFVTFIKGNKSRPGGFGRQWGHHVRGEVSIDKRKLPVPFVALEEDLSILASVCRDKGLEDEFKGFVMQHG